MFQKYQIMDVASKSSLFLSSINLSTSSRVLIHKIITPSSPQLLSSLLSQPYSTHNITITQYYQASNSLFIVLEDTYPLTQLVKSMDVQETVKMMREVCEISERRKEVLFHTQLFMQKGRLGVYTLGGVDQKVSGLYRPPQKQYKKGLREVKQQKYKQSYLIWTLGILFSHLFLPETILKESIFDYNKSYKCLLSALDKKVKEDEGEKMQGVWCLVKEMVRYVPRERVTWSILGKGLGIVEEQVEMEKKGEKEEEFRCDVRVKYRNRVKKLDQSMISQQPSSPPKLIQTLLNTSSTHHPRSKNNCQSFISKPSSHSPHRKLKPNKSNFDFSSSYLSHQKYQKHFSPSKHSSFVKMDGTAKSMFRSLNRFKNTGGKENEAMKYIEKEKENRIKGVTFLQMLENKKKNKKNNSSFLIKNQMVYNNVDDSVGERNRTCVMGSDVKENIIVNSNQITMRGSFRKNDMKMQQKLYNQEKNDEKEKGKQALREFLQKQRKNTHTMTESNSVRPQSKSYITPSIVKQITPAPQYQYHRQFNVEQIQQKVEQISQQPQKTQNYQTPNHQQIQEYDTEQFEQQVMSYSESNNTLVQSQMIEVKNTQFVDQVNENTGKIGNKRKSKFGEQIGRIDEIKNVPLISSYYIERDSKLHQEQYEEKQKEIESKDSKRQDKMSEKQIGGVLGAIRQNQRQSSSKQKLQQPRQSLQQNITESINTIDSFVESKQTPQVSSNNTDKSKAYPYNALTTNESPSTKPDTISLSTAPTPTLSPPPRLPSPFTPKSIKAFNLLGQTVKHANLSLKSQRPKWLFQCFLIYKCYWYFRTTLPLSSLTSSLPTFSKDNQNITLGLHSMYNLTHKLLTTSPIYLQNKDLVTLSALTTNWKGRYLWILNTFYYEMIEVLKTERVQLVSKGKYKGLVKFTIMVGVAVVIIGGYGEWEKEEQRYQIVDVSKCLIERLGETEEGEIILDSFVQEVGHRMEKVMNRINGE